MLPQLYHFSKMKNITWNNYYFWLHLDIQPCFYPFTDAIKQNIIWEILIETSKRLNLLVYLNLMNCKNISYLNMFCVFYIVVYFCNDVLS